MAIEALARAKINLALHVTGRRGDGYHLLDSLVAFAEVGDRITVEPAAKLSMSITGPFAANLSATDNLCLRAAHSLQSSQGARIMLEKNLPVASGIGGGSADAAATLTALSRLWTLPLPGAKAVLALGADVPVCLAGHCARMSGIGDELQAITLPLAQIVLINPGVALSTSDVFRTLHRRDNPPLPAMPALRNAHDLAAFLRDQRNDLEPPARTLAPAIVTVIEALTAQTACLIARMSGSGATCFGMFATETAAHSAAETLQNAHPDWWIKPTSLAP